MQKELEKSFDDELRNMPEPQVRQFAKILIDVLNDRAWCLSHNISYCNPNILQSRNALLIELRELRYLG